MFGPRPVSLRPVQLKGSALARRLLAAAGWRVEFEGLPSRQGVIVVYPHTSNWDFVVGLLAKWSIGIPVHFWGKDSLFRVPLFGRWIRAVGGVPINRNAPQGVVADTVRQIEEARARDEFFWLALAPEGTRSRTEGWRSGFHRVAVQACVPLGIASLDYASKRVSLLQFMALSGDADADMAAIAQGLASCRGLKHELAAPIRLI